ncbi:MAG: DNA repair protein RecN [Pseudomonadota bacterium]
MLASLSIRDLVIIEALELNFASGLGVLTGETGAGKSILLDALGLVLGARADSGLVRAGSEKARVTAGFEVALDKGSLADLLADNDIEIETGEPLIIRRQVKADGGSRAHINDQPVSAALLREVATHLVEIHGQHDDRGLINPAGHRQLLDSFAKADIASVAAAYADWRKAEAALEQARAEMAEAERDRDFLQHSLEELHQFAPEAGEEEALALERATMQKGEKLSESLSEITAMLEGSDSPLAALRSLTRKLDRIAPDHEMLAEALSALDRALIEAVEGEEKLAVAQDALLFDPERLDDIETRLFALRALARKHDVAGDDLPALMQKMEAQWAALESGSGNLAALEAECAKAREAYIAAAKALHQARITAGESLDSTVANELKPLKLDAARFQTAISELPEERWGPNGISAVEFLISTNPGSDFAPLMKIASGGELSRFILALKVALAEQGGAATMIFDEIDRGVGGAVASAIGERLSRLSRQTQLLVVTHSPQVAAKGDHHLLISKSSDGTVARTNVQALDAATRQEEIARMLSGEEVTQEARAQADRLLERV